MSYRAFLNTPRDLFVVGACGAAGFALFQAIAPGVAPLAPSAPPPSINLSMVPLQEPMSGVNRLYGTVVTSGGEELTGFLRWDRNEGSWSDALHMAKASTGSSSELRFGHLDALRMTERGAVALLRSGREELFEENSSDLGALFRDLEVSGPRVRAATLSWSDLQSVRFRQAPEGLDAPGGRLHGTLETRGNRSFTGLIAWDKDEIYTTDILDGEARGQDYEIPFGMIASIERTGHGGHGKARVVLHSGESLTLSGTNDVNRRNRGITVADPGLGQVTVDWAEFKSVRFHGDGVEESRADFDGGAALYGEVRTRSGELFYGRIFWDQDESWSWETLNGVEHEAEFEIEFSKIESIHQADAHGHGAVVTLRDGRVFSLRESNDVDRGNRGIVVVEEDGSRRKVPWSDFSQLLLDARP